jgi:tetratricopeptide (TPR) repeat protein
MSALEQAVRLYRGDLLGGQCDEWALIEAERLRALYLEALQNLVSGYKTAGDYQAALRHALLLTSYDPLREDAHREVMRLQFMLGQRNAALQQYRLVRKLLHEELRQEPMPETTVLYDETLKSAKVQSPLLQAPPPLFDAFHCLPIVGRENERRDLLTCVEAAMTCQGGLALVGGEAGVGKTRLASEIAADAQWRGATVLWGRGRDLDAVPPYAPLVEALDKGLTPLRASQLAHLADRTWLSQMSVLLPSLSKLIPDLPRPPQLSRKEDQARLQQAVGKYLRT